MWLFLHVLLELNGSDTQRKKSGAEKAYLTRKKNGKLNGGKRLGALLCNMKESAISVHPPSIGLGYWHSEEFK